MRHIEPDTTSGKITLAALLSLLGVVVVAYFFNIERGGNLYLAQADEATTTVTVINLPPTWTVEVREKYESSTSSPTNVGTSTVWVATATDSNGEDYYLIICKTNVTPTPGSGGSAPTCDGGTSNQWAVSAAASSGVEAIATRVALDSDAESNDWYGFICDSNAGDPKCSSDYRTGTSSGAGSSSPFVVNHAPTFTVFADDSPTLPGDVVTWTTTATDTDTLRGGDLLTLYVCKSTDFNGTNCNTEGWATSSPALGNPSTSTTLTIPLQDKDYGAYGYIVDQFGLVATGSAQGIDSVLTVANAAPTISSSTIDLGSSTPLTLTVEAGETTGLILNFEVSDNNSCQNASGGNEIADYIVNIHRSGIATTSCDQAGEYDPNNCYPSDVGTGVWNLSCSQNAATCSGAGDVSAEWNCTFPLWFLADPTDAGSYFESQNWVATVRAVDDNFATSAPVTDSDGEELLQFLAFNATGSPIAYGALEPGQNTGTLLATTTLEATGNTGLDQQLLGTDMCVTYPNCTGNATSTIFVNNQQYATTSGTLYGSGTALSNSTSSTIQINIASTTATSSFSSGDTYWGIAVPSAITFAGDYIGVNTIIGVVGDVGGW